MLEIPRSRLKSGGDRSFSVSAPTIWNRLPEHIKNVNTTEQFKAKLKTHYFSLAYCKAPCAVFYWICALYKNLFIILLNSIIATERESNTVVLIVTERIEVQTYSTELSQRLRVKYGLITE